LINSIRPPPGQSVSCQGDTVIVNGSGLGNAVGIVLSSPRHGIHYPLITPTVAGAASVRFVVPNDPTGLPVGVYMLSVQTQPSGQSSPLSGLTSTNSLPLAIAPQLISSPPLAGSVTGPAFTLTPTCVPDLRATQQVSLVVGSLAVPANPFATSSTNTPTFNFQNVPPGTYLVRLRVDGIDSPITYTPLPGSPVIQVT